MSKDGVRGRVGDRLYVIRRHGRRRPGEFLVLGVATRFGGGWRFYDFRQNRWRSPKYWTTPDRSIPPWVKKLQHDILPRAEWEAEQAAWRQQVKGREAA